MVFPKYSFKSAKVCASITLLFSCFLTQAETSNSWPVFAAQLSDGILQICETQHCELNVLDSQTLEAILNQHPLSLEIFEALTLSEYELLVSSAAISSSPEAADAHSKTLVLEMTTSWRGIPVDDFNITSEFEGSVNEAAELQINAWVDRVQNDGVFEAQRIYQKIGASDYHQHMQLPEKIGDFIFTETALYHDPMQGSISRYIHPLFADAVVDVSVYPVSPFIHKTQGAAPLESEMAIEKSHIQQLILQAQLDDYQISDIQSTQFTSTLGEMKGLSMEVALQTRVDPIYSTQFLFTKNDKFIKVTGNLPKTMMLALVQESIGQITVPQESTFMQSMRQQ
ncbi:hypothetical protein [Glaciecola sp. SC05]|uniref:hypothetical protein n=1 Tax=Glaciecola sp. SC05 TaxID=1987355 RepID=UPI0035286E81